MLLTRKREIEVYDTKELDVEKKTVKEIFKVAIKKVDKHQHQVFKSST